MSVASDQLKKAEYVLIDALKFRNPACRMTRKHLSVRKCYYSVPVTLFLVAVCLILLILPLMEHQDSFSLSSNYSHDIKKVQESYENYFKVSIPLEMVFLAVLTISCAIRCYLAFPSKISMWRILCNHSYYRSEIVLVIMYILVLAITWLICLASLILYYTKHFKHSEQHTFLFIRQLFRPFFLIAHIQLMRKVIKATAIAFKSVLKILVLLALALFLFTLIGVIIHDRAPNEHNHDGNTTNEYFESIARAHWSLLVYLTTANSPDIMTPTYEDNRFFFVFFGTYFFVTHYFILKVLDALLAAKFVSFFKESVQRSYKYRIINVKFAFDLLQTVEHKEKKDTVTTQNIVKKATVKRLQLDYTEDDIKNVYGECNCADSAIVELDWDKFMDVFLKLFENSSKLKERQENENKWKHYIWYIVDGISIVLAITHVIALTSLLVLLDSERKFDDDQYIYSLSQATFVFSFLFLFFEFVPRIVIPIMINCCIFCRLHFPYCLVSYTCKEAKNKVFKECKEAKNKIFKTAIIIIKAFDIVLLFAVIVMGLLHGPCVFDKESKFFICKVDTEFTALQVTNVLVLLRLIRLIITTDFFSDITHTLIHIVVLLIPIGLLGYIFYYIFAVTGIYLFEFEFENATLTNRECQMYEYHSYNFQDFASSLVTLWNLMIGSNWHIITECYSGLTSLSSRLFFVTWWMLSETILNGVFFGTLLYIIEQAINHERKKDGCNADGSGDDLNRECWQKVKQNFKTCREILQETGIINNERNNKYGFKSRINTWSIFHVRDFDDIDVKEIENEIDIKCYIHPDLPSKGGDGQVNEQRTLYTCKNVCEIIIRTLLIVLLLIILLIFFFILTDITTLL